MMWGKRVELARSSRPSEDGNRRTHGLREPTDDGDASRAFLVGIVANDDAEPGEIRPRGEDHAGLRAGATGCSTPAFAAHVLQRVTPRMLQMMQMKVPQSAQG
jgi:hypothetical protein